jgi:hypothetical protein
MIRTILLLSFVFLTLATGAGPVRAQFDDGVKALQAGDYAAALGAWQKGAESGDARSQYSIGYLNQFGLGMPVDLAKAKEWYEKAAAQNNADALYAVGLMYETGKAGRKDLAEAMRYYRRAAETGSQPDAEYAVGRMILRGRGVPRDPIEGVKWLKKAAQHNQPAAQFMLGAAYEAGWGVQPNTVEAYYWYSRSLDGDEVELHEHDMAFQPKIALDALRKHLSADELRRIEARLKADRAALKKADGTTAAASSDKAAKPGKAPNNRSATPDRSLPDALTKQQ